MNTKDGILKAQETIIRKYGRTKDGRSILHVIAGTEGGKIRNRNKGFGGNRERARTAGAKGGTLSRKGVPLTPEERQHILERIVNAV